LAMANVFIQFTGHFSKMGLGLALIQRPNIQEEDVRASFTLAVVLGIAFAVATVLISPLAGVFFKSESVDSVVRWLSLSFVLAGFSLSAMSLLRRELRFKAVAIVELSAFVLGNGVITVSCAALGFGVWSLVAGMLAQQAIMLVISFVIVRHSLVPIFSLSAYRKSLRLGAHYSVNSILDFLYAKVEVLFMGRCYTERFLGLYDRGYRLTHMLVQHMAVSVSKVMFPVFSRLQGQKESLCRAFLKTFSVVGLVGSGICAGMVPAAREIVLVMLGPKWQEAILPLQILAVAVPIHYLINIQGVLLDGTAQLAARSKARIYGIIFKVLALVYSASFGFHGILVGIGVSLLFQIALTSCFVIRRTGISVGSFASSCLLLLPNAAFVGGLTWGVTFVGRALDLAPPLLLIVQMATGALALFTSFSVVLRYSLCGLRAEDFKTVPILARIWN